MAGGPGEEEEQTFFQRPTRGHGYLQTLHLRAGGLEVDGIDAAEGGGVLILTPDGLPQLVDLDAAG